MEKETEDLERARIQMDQMLLPGQTARQVSRSIKLPWTKVRRLHEKGFLSFDPDQATTLSPFQEAELIFLGELVGHGCSYHMLRLVLQQLRKPYAYDHGVMFYDWHARTWRLHRKDDDLEGNFHNLVNRLAAHGDRRSLLVIREWNEEALDLENEKLHFLSHEGN